jgi:hypothetical protein
MPRKAALLRLVKNLRMAIPLPRPKSPGIQNPRIQRAAIRNREIPSPAILVPAIPNRTNQNRAAQKALPRREVKRKGERNAGFIALAHANIAENLAPASDFSAQTPR